MSNEISGVNNRPSTQPKQNEKKEQMSLDEAAKIVYEESIFSKGSKIYKALNEDIPKKILEKSQSWGWVQTLQKAFGIEPKQDTQKPKQDNK